MNLLIVESPAKAKTIAKFLGRDYSVKSSYGHIRDLPKRELGVDLEHNFKPKYVIPVKARAVAKKIKEAAQKADLTILASVDYKEPILIQCPDGLIRQFEVGAFIDEILENKVDFSSFEIPAFDFKTQRISFKPIKGISRHPTREELLEISSDYGRKIRITASHSVFTKNKKNEIKLVSGKYLKIGDKLLVPLKLSRGRRKIKKLDSLKAIYQNKELREKAFIHSPKVARYRKEKTLAPKIGNIPQFQPRIIFSSKLRGSLKNKRMGLGWSQKLLANKINCSQPEICDWENGKRNPTLPLGGKYLNILGFNLKKVLENPGARLAPSSIEIAIKNALENQWHDSRKSLNRTWQPLSWFTWKEIEKNFGNDRTIKISRHNHSHLMPRFIPVNKELMLFLGFLVAEGSYLKNGNALKFSFGKKTIGGEEKNIEKVKEISKRLFNISPSDFQDRSSNSVVLSSSLVAFLIKSVLKVEGNARTKEIPWIVFNVRRALQFAFLKGFFLGDGSLNKTSIAFNTVSPKLAQGIRFILLQNDILSSHSLAISKKPNRKPLHQVIICGKQRLSKTKQIWQEHYKAAILKKHLQWKNAKSDNKKNWSLVQNQKEDLGLLKIKSIRRVKPSKKFVYDFSVRGENFVCGSGGICAHNTDSDREGEAIAWHVLQILDSGQPPAGRKNYQRIVFHEITKKAIEQALKNPRQIDMALVNAQQTRRILDRLVGYELSPFLWKKVAKGLSAGRVQSVAVRLIVDREREIEKFKPEEYWSIEAKLKKQEEPDEFIARLIKKDNQSIPKLGIKTKPEADKILTELKGANYQVVDLESKEIRRYPAPPFMTSTLQQEAVKKLGFSAKQTMRLAQQLYEGIRLGKKGSVGLITYHRTDSLNLSIESLKAARELIKKNFGQKYALASPKIYKTKSQRAQEAHEAIRPTKADRQPDKIKAYLDRRQYQLYDLIWRRFIACQMQPALLDSTSVDIQAKNYLFRATGSVIKFDGFLKIYPLKQKELMLPPLTKEEMLQLIKLFPEQHFTEGPARYSEATLVKTLEEYGIGRPSTYAPIISTIQERNYVEKNEQKRFIPTEIGSLVTDLLKENFSQIVDVKFTAYLEEDLDRIAQGKQNWLTILKEFYQPFHRNLLQKEKEVKKKKIEEPTDKKCPKCGSPIVIKLGRFGKFYACSGFPECKYTEPIVNSTGVKCPRCGQGEIVERKTKKGKTFYSCSRYPQCDFALWDKPTGEKCPKCDSLLVETKNKQIKCSNKECDYRKK